MTRETLLIQTDSAIVDIVYEGLKDKAGAIGIIKGTNANFPGTSYLLLQNVDSMVALEAMMLGARMVSKL